MENKTIGKTLKLLSQLMELHDENPFKIKSIASAAFKVDKLPFRAADKTLKELEEVSGIGKSTASKIWELIHNQTITDLENLLIDTPTGIVEMLQIKGLGPKKISVIWKDLTIETIGELFYACNENRLAEAKGFGLKTQEEIKNAIKFKMASHGRFLYAQVEVFAEQLLAQLKTTFNSTLVSFTADYRRRNEIIDRLTLLAAVSLDVLRSQADKIPSLSQIQITDNGLEAEGPLGIKVYISLCAPENFAFQLIMQTGNTEHIEELKTRLESSAESSTSETEIYKLAGLPFIEPELREGLNEFKLAENDNLPTLLDWSDLKGSLHNHSTWSDGIHSLEEMATFCKDELKLQYLGICDHSRSAFYAKGLSEERVLAQHREIDTLNVKLTPFKIFKGIESDILFDGSLDYTDEILSSFDFVVASIHSVFKMSEEKATDRLIKAIENPYTTILGHPTGRLLLSRGGYPINFEKVIDACAANKVVIEINANPLRLDLDWRWHRYALEKGVLLSVNPDAHRKDGFYDMRYGVLIARKGGLSAENCLNTFDLNRITNFFGQRKSALTP